MSVKSPKERVYYYECSYGKFRLTYFIPYGELEKLSKEGIIKKQVLEDFPDGVDLRVGETDYKDFEESYGYGPEVDPEVARSTFFTILSSTRNWKKFRGSDIIPAKDLEGRIADIEESVKEKKDQLFLDFIKLLTLSTSTISLKGYSLNASFIICEMISASSGLA